MMIFMGFLPDDGVSVVSINGARSYGWTFGWSGFQQGLDYALGLPAAEENAKRRLEGRVESQVRYGNRRMKRREDALRQARSEAAAALRTALAGGYRSAAYGEAQVCEQGGKLMLTIGRFSAELLPVAADKAVMFERAYGSPGEVPVAWDGAADTLSFTWEGGTFERVPGNACVGAGAKGR
jgi:hypothetical protein